jgi:hypothetical protein
MLCHFLRHKLILKNAVNFANDVNHEKFDVNLKSCLLHCLTNLPIPVHLQGHKADRTKANLAKESALYLRFPKTS